MGSFFTGFFSKWAASDDHESSSKVKGKAAPASSSPLASVFKLLDQNGDGLLSVQEMSEGFQKLGVELSPPLLISLLSSFPLSLPGFLLFHEFEALYASISNDLSIHAHPPHHHPSLGSPNPCPHLAHDGASLCGCPTSSLDDIHRASASDTDLASAKSSDVDLESDDDDDDDIRHPHIHLATSSVVHTSNALMDASHDELSTDDKHMCHDNNDDDDDLLEAFRIFDKNADGFISMPELQTVMCSLGFSQCQDDSFCQGILQRVDSNGDGLVDFSEFKHMMTVSRHF